MPLSVTIQLQQPKRLVTCKISALVDKELNCHQQLQVQQNSHNIYFDQN